MKIYNLADFKAIISSEFTYHINSSIINELIDLSSQIDGFIKPINIKPNEDYIFKSSTINNQILQTDSDIFLKKKKRNVEITDTDNWESFRSFQTTKMDDNTGLNIEIKSNLNRLTNKNFLEITNNITNILNNLIKEEITKEEMNKIIQEIFDIASKNKFYSKIYADLISVLINKFNTIKELYEQKLNELFYLFDDIKYISGEVNYDLFCVYNKQNEERKAISSFFVNLTLNKILDSKKVIELIMMILDKINVLILEENKKNEVDELIENVAILYKDIKSPKFDEKIIKIITTIANSTTKMYPSLSNKTIFKCMDIIEI